MAEESVENFMRRMEDLETRLEELEDLQLTNNLIIREVRDELKEIKEKGIKGAPLEEKLKAFEDIESRIEEDLEVLDKWRKFLEGKKDLSNIVSHQHNLEERIDDIDEALKEVLKRLEALEKQKPPDLKKTHEMSRKVLEKVGKIEGLGDIKSIQKRLEILERGFDALQHSVSEMRKEKVSRKKELTREEVIKISQDVAREILGKVKEPKVKIPKNVVTHSDLIKLRGELAELLEALREDLMENIPKSVPKGSGKGMDTSEILKSIEKEMKSYIDKRFKEKVKDIEKMDTEDLKKELEKEKGAVDKMLEKVSNLSREFEKRIETLEKLNLRMEHLEKKIKDLENSIKGLHVQKPVILE